MFNQFFYVRVVFFLSWFSIDILRDIKASGITNVLPKNEKGNPDLSPLGSQAQEIWKLLDRMSTEDPAVRILSYYRHGFS